MRLARALGALVVLAALLMGVPWLLVEFIGNPWPAEGVSPTAPLTDGAVIGLLAAVVWILWLQLFWCVIVEAAAALSGDRVQLRATLTFGPQQLLARQLVTALVVATVATPSVAATAMATAPSAAPAQQSHADHAIAAAVVSHGPTGSEQRAQSTSAQSTSALPTPAPTSTVAVMRLDSLWSIAERVLGDGERWMEIAALNEGREMRDGTVFRAAENIQPGWELLVPGAEATTDQPTGAHVVEPGDTLSGIAAEELGDADQWPDLYEKNRAVVGENPDLILPGQVIEFPGGRHAPSQATSRPESEPLAERPAVQQEPAPGHHRGHSLAMPQTPMVPEPNDAIPEAATTEVVASASASEVGDSDRSEITALRALLATALCLSAGAFAMLLANRRRQFRQRRSGRSIAATPEELVGVERAVSETGSEAMETTEFIDLALRHLAASQRVAGQALPNVGAAVIGEEELAVLFTEPVACGAPYGWAATSDGGAWTLPRDTVFEDELRQQPAPYPALVSVGVDADRRTWMLDLEASGVFGVAGAGAQVEDLVRFIVAELALNAWSEGTEVMLSAGFASETAGLNPTRVQLVDADTAARRGARLAREAMEAAENLGTDLLGLRRDAIAIDSTGTVVIIVPGAAGSELADAVRGRTRSRVVVVHDEQMPTVELTSDGMAYLPTWGVTLEPLLLSAEQAGAMADLMAAVRQTDDQPMPAADESSAVGRFITADGALREEFTAARAVEGDDPSSLLPDADEVYVAAAATTTEDLAALAPSVPAEIRAEVEALDPGLDDDLAAWRDPESRRPRVQVMGPVDVDSWGARKEEVANLGGTIEFIVYLACQEHGVTPERAAVALGWSEATVHNRARDARRLLGERVDGGPWLPEATKSRTAQLRGVAAYELDPELLVAADLFRRLRLRGQARGAHGLEDLVAALSLVTGRPFDRLRKRGYGWLVENPLDHHLCHAIVDVAHLIVGRALSIGDTSMARWACEIAMKAAPDEDKPRLDLAAVTAAEGSGSVDDLLDEQIIHRVDEDLTARSEQIIDRRGWLAS